MDRIAPDPIEKSRVEALWNPDSRSEQILRHDCGERPIIRPDIGKRGVPYGLAGVMVEDDLRLDSSEPVAEKCRLRIHDGNQPEVLQIGFVQHSDLRFHLPDKFRVLIADHRFGRDKDAFHKRFGMFDDFAQRHCRGYGIRIRAAVHQDRKGVTLLDHRLKLEDVQNRLLFSGKKPFDAFHGCSSG